MRKPTKPRNDPPKTHAPRILAQRELQLASGGDEGAAAQVLKTRHETAKNSIGN